ncbi:MAG: AarF/ABC1/UbiB kinase family protein [Pontixanthobacter sp.]
MSDDQTPDRANAARHRSVPSSRLSRLGGFGRLAGGLAGGMVAEGARRIASGERPRMQDMILTPGNAMRLADRLSHLRGAAMKLGQMISMDAGDLLPPELSAILAGLRDNANYMPPRQLQQMLKAEWGDDWRKRFAHFRAQPIAAASIGQVHRATTHDGRTLAIKVQYPGIKDSIDADVDNVATLLNLSKMIPPQLDLAPFLEAAKAQLHEEADYRREARQMQLYRERLAGDDRFVVPLYDDEFSTDRILSMSFEPGVAIESLETADQTTRDEVGDRIIRLVARELFDFGVMQTDPNFANYRYRPEDGAIVLLDFGATRDVDPAIQTAYRNLIAAALGGDRSAVIDASLAAGFMKEDTVVRHRRSVEAMTDIILKEFEREGDFDFGDRAFVEVLRDEGMVIAADKSAWHLPPFETIFVQRKISGTALLCARLKARVPVRDILQGAVA